jgi:hypothetical protein
MFVYVIVNSDTLKIYVGQHKGDNLRKYLQTKFSDANHQVRLQSRLCRSMRKYPKEVWSIQPLVSDLQTRAACDEWERHYIKVLNTQHPAVGYNICRGGEGGAGFAKGHVVTPTMRRKIARAHQGRKTSLETRQKQRASAKGHPPSRLGQHQTLEAIAKIAAARRGQKSTPETLAKMSAARRGISWSAARRAAYCARWGKQERK